MSFVPTASDLFVPTASDLRGDYKALRTLAGRLLEVQNLASLFIYENAGGGPAFDGQLQPVKWFDDLPARGLQLNLRVRGLSRGLWTLVQGVKAELPAQRLSIRAHHVDEDELRPRLAKNLLRPLAGKLPALTVLTLDEVMLPHATELVAFTGLRILTLHYGPPGVAQPATTFRLMTLIPMSFRSRVIGVLR